MKNFENILEPLEVEQENYDEDVNKFFIQLEEADFDNVFVGDAFGDDGEEDNGDLFDNFGDDDYVEEDKRTKSTKSGSKNNKFLKKKRNIEYEYEKDEDEKLLQQFNNKTVKYSSL